MDRSVLSFKNQAQGAEGLLVNADNFTIENLAIEDTVGDAIKINESDNVVIRNVRTEWTGGPLTTNGAYGIYPVQSSNILIDGAVAIGASDAGIYVGQSTQIIVRIHAPNITSPESKSRIQPLLTFMTMSRPITRAAFWYSIYPIYRFRAAGIPGFLTIKSATITLKISRPRATSLAKCPGTGMMVLANDSIEVFGNEFADNDSANVMIVSYFITERPFDDPNYDPFPESIYIHDNSFSGGGASPDSEPLTC